jgi:protein-disulfide isomerase
MNRRFGIIATAFIAVALFAGGAVIYSGSGASKPPAPVAAVPADVFVRPHSPVIGPKNAPVTIVEFFDPSCEACRAFYPVVKQVMAAYPNDVRLVLRYLPLHQGSAEAVTILEAARAQGVYEPVVEAVLEAQPDWHDGQMAGAWAAAEKAGLDVAKAKALPTAPAMAAMDADIADGDVLKVRGTPTLFINGKRLAELSPDAFYTQVKAEVDASRK